MKVLVFLGNDAANLSIESIVKELNVRHEVKLIASSTNPQKLHMFQDIADVILPFSQCTDAVVAWADCIFCTVMSATKLLNYNKYVFSFCHMNQRFDEPRGYDFVFTLGELGEQDVPTYFASMPVGLAKNDIPVSVSTKKQILYIDAGHFPFGNKGQTQIAEMILKICREFPDYNICVKPRWFPNATNRDMTNPNFSHIYNVLDSLCPNGLPENLELLSTYRNMQELIDESECVISSCTSAYLDVAVRGKPLLIIKGIANEDTYHLRNNYFENLYRFAEGSGCVVDYREITSFLPKGRICDPEHIRQACAYQTGATDRVINAMEYIYENYIAQGRYPDIKEYHYETYQKELSSDTGLDIEDLLCNRRFCMTETCMLLTYKLSDAINWRPYYQQQMALCWLSVGGNDSTVSRKRAAGQLRTNVEGLKCRYLIKNADKLDNDVEQSYLFYAHYQRKDYGLLIERYRSDEYPHESLLYYVGEIYWKMDQTRMAADLFKKYLTQSMSRDYEKYMTDDLSNRVSAFEKVFIQLLKEDERNELQHYAGLFLKFAERYPRQTRFSDKVMRQFHARLVNSGAVEMAAALNLLVPERVTGKLKSLRYKSKSIKNKSKALCKKTLSACKKWFREKVYFAKKSFEKFKMYRRIKALWDRFRRTIKFYHPQERAVLSFQDKYSGRSCFIVENGASLNAADLERIAEQGYICFASNNIYKMYGKTSWRPNYYACVDKSVFDQNAIDILSETACPMFLHHQFEARVRKYKNFFKKPIAKVFFTHYSDRKGKARFFPQAAIVDSGGTATFFLLELAWMMGFRNFYLIGCDHSCAFNRLESGTEIDSSSAINRDYFSEDYMRSGEIMKVGDLDKAAEGYRVARDYIESHGGHLYNATRGGNLEVLKRVDLDELVGKTQSGLEKDDEV